MSLESYRYFTHEHLCPQSTGQDVTCLPLLTRMGDVALSSWNNCKNKANWAASL